jgi:Flp pilus assembly protein TadG
VSKVVKDDSGSALIWFVFLVALLCMLVLTLATSVHQYLFARELIDFTEQFALAIKTKLQYEGSQVSSIATALLSEVSPQYGFDGLRLNQVSLEAGETVKVIFCADWNSPVASVDASRRICEMALAR